MPTNVNTGTSELKDSVVQCHSSQGVEFRASLMRLTRYLAVIEIHSPGLVLLTSEVLTDFKIVIRDRTVYSGRAVVSNMVNAGAGLVCEVKLDEASFSVASLSLSDANALLRDGFNDFLTQWQNLYRISPEFKVVMADFQTFLTDLRQWLEHVELEIRSSPSADRIQLERAAVDELREPVIRSIDTFIDRFETMAEKIETPFQPVHQNYLRRQLHPLLLCSPFAYRTYQKPLGYAGDYEVVDMMLRPPYEGSTLFAKMINVWLWGQAPATAHRNRVAYLEQKLVEETMRARAAGHTARVFNFACGPAAEVQAFIRNHAISDFAHLTMLDFNEETLVNLRAKLESIKQFTNRHVGLEFVKKSVHHILKESGKTIHRPAEQLYDFVYCAGLFDYLSDQVCRRLMNIMYDMVAPGGLLLATNVGDALNSSRPFRYSMEYILDWHLIYRDADKVASLAPTRAVVENIKVITENTGVNVFIEVRKPKDA